MPVQGEAVSLPDQNPDKRRAHVYITTDDEREAQNVCERLWREGRREATYTPVQYMALVNDPRTPHTTDRFAVLVEQR